MRVILVNTGTELLLGDVRDAHLSFIAQQILPLGLRIIEQRTVPDGGPAIRDTLVEVLPRAEIIIVTGGLGPTTDDITREIIAELLGLRLVHDDQVWQLITDRLTSRRIPITERVRRQASVPEGAEVLPNDNGTAPGLYLRQDIGSAINSPDLFLLPGPPRELQPMFRNSVRPKLRSLAPPASAIRRVYRIAGMGESLVENAVGAQLLAIPGIELGYCARPGDVDLRVIAGPAILQTADEIIHRALGSAIFSVADQTLEEVLVRALAMREARLALAESCTGGLLAHRITNVPGASKVFLAAYITYSNEAKADVLGVDHALLEKHGAVSGEVARAMAEGARRRAQADFALSTTGIAGPDGDSPGKPVGTVFVALAAPNSETTVRRLFYPSDRETFKYVVAQNAFEMLRQHLAATTSPQPA